MDTGENDIELNAVLKRIGRDYNIQKKLGCGSFSKVFLVQHKIFGEPRALKIMYASYILKKIKRFPDKIMARYNNVSQRFITEAKIYRRIEHPNIVKIFEVSFVEDKTKKIQIPYMIIQYIRGKILEDLLKCNSPLKMPFIYLIAEHILSALAAIHKENIIHRDIKPNNIVLDYDNNKAVLIDFGLAKDLVHGRNMTALGALLGNPHYIPPEQMQFHRTSLPGSRPTWDIFSFGVVLFRMLTGQYPYKRNSIMEFVKKKITIPNVRDLNPELPPGIEQVIFKAAAWDPAHRYQSAEEFLNALKKIKSDSKNSKSLAKEKINEKE